MLTTWIVSDAFIVIICLEPSGNLSIILHFPETGASSREVPLCRISELHPSCVRSMRSSCIDEFIECLKYFEEGWKWFRSDFSLGRFLGNILTSFLFVWFSPFSLTGRSGSSIGEHRQSSFLVDARRVLPDVNLSFFGVSSSVEDCVKRYAVSSSTEPSFLPLVSFKDIAMAAAICESSVSSKILCWEKGVVINWVNILLDRALRYEYIF